MTTRSGFQLPSRRFGCAVAVSVLVLFVEAGCGVRDAGVQPVGPAAHVAAATPHAVAPMAAVAPAAAPPPIDFGAAAPSSDVRFIAEWSRASNDHGSRPFAILDKRGARVFVFDRQARLIAASPVLLGLAIGDDSVPGIGERPIAQVRPGERTTPAGRFVSEPGKNASGEDVVWIDYDAAVSMHRVRPTNPKERRLQRLASPDPAQRRISYGCVNLPVTFFEKVVWPVIGPAHGVVYVLPERHALRAVFADAYDARAMADARVDADPRGAGLPASAGAAARQARASLGDVSPAPLAPPTSHRQNAATL